MIQKKVHYCWFGGNQYPLLVEKCIKTWEKKLPGYEFKLWNEDNSPMHIGVVKKAYSQKNYAFVSDYVRLYALHEEGGIYLDTDTEVIRDFEPLLNEKCFLGFSQKRYVTNAIMGGHAGFFFFKEAMELMESMHGQKKEQLTSPRVTTAVLEKHGLKDYGEQHIGEIKILPIEAFYPYNPFDPDRPLNNFFYEDVKENTFTVHHYLASWNKQGAVKTIVNLLKGKK